MKLEAEQNWRTANDQWVSSTLPLRPAIQITFFQQKNAFFNKQIFKSLFSGWLYVKLHSQAKDSHEYTSPTLHASEVSVATARRAWVGLGRPETETDSKDVFPLIYGEWWVISSHVMMNRLTSLSLSWWWISCHIIRNHHHHHHHHHHRNKNYSKYFVKSIFRNNKKIQDKIQAITLPETNSSHLKMDVCKTIRLPFGAIWAYLQGANLLLVLGGVSLQMMISNTNLTSSRV